MFLQQIRLPNVLVRRMHVIVPIRNSRNLKRFRLDDYFKDQSKLMNVLDFNFSELLGTIQNNLFQQSLCNRHRKIRC